jgi:hypothetical protein
LKFSEVHFFVFAVGPRATRQRGEFIVRTPTLHQADK